jgi:hypothetical protein
MELKNVEYQSSLAAMRRHGTASDRAPYLKTSMERDKLEFKLDMAELLVDSNKEKILHANAMRGSPSNE